MSNIQAVREILYRGLNEPKVEEPTDKQVIYLPGANIVLIPSTTEEK